MTHPLDPPADPREVAQQAAADIRRITGVDRHDIALTLGSGWAKAADLIGETTHTIPATEVDRIRKSDPETAIFHCDNCGAILVPT